MPVKSNTPTVQITQSYEDTQQSRYIIYAYLYKDSGKVAYIGKDSNGNVNRRYNNHSDAGKAKDQTFNNYIQSKEKNADYLEYRVLAICESSEEMSNLETMYILFYKAFNQAIFNKVVSMKQEMFDELMEGLDSMDVLFNDGLHSKKGDK